MTMTQSDIALSGLRNRGPTVTQGSATPQAATLHPGLRVLRPFGTGFRGENMNVAMVRDLGHANDRSCFDREKAAMGFFVTLAEPTRPMKEEAVSAGFYQPPSPFQGEGRGVVTEYPKLQILTIEGLMSGTERPRFPDLTLGRSTFKRAAVEDMGAEQGKLL